MGQTVPSDDKERKLAVCHARVRGPCVAGMGWGNRTDVDQDDADGLDADHTRNGNDKGNIPACFGGRGRAKWR